MKASEAIHILENLDPNQEVTLYLGPFRAKQPFPKMPAWKQTYPYHQMMPQSIYYPNEITCKTVH